jgi:putative oxidoreductase
MLDGLGIGVPWLMAYAIGGLEFFGGILLIVGVAVRAIAVLGAVEMLVAGLTVHLPAGFNFMNVTGMTPDGGMQFGLPGYEVNLLYFAGFASLIISGAGALALPSLFKRDAIKEREATRKEPEYTLAGRA